MGPRGGLSLRSGTGCPAPHWKLETEKTVSLVGIKAEVFTCV